MNEVNLLGKRDIAIRKAGAFADEESWAQFLFVGIGRSEAFRVLFTEQMSLTVIA